MLLRIMHTVIILKPWNSFNPELKLQNTDSAFKNRLKTSLNELRGFKFVIALVLKLKKKKKKNIK